MGLTQRLGTIPLAIQTDSSNNVGIGGAANASYKLAVTGASNFSGALRTESTINMTGTSAQLLQTTANSIAGDNVAVLYNSNANSYGLYIGAGSGTNHALYITDSTRSKNLFKVEGNGSIGIGTGNPVSLGASYTTLEIKGQTGLYGGAIQLTSADGTNKGRVYVANDTFWVGTQNSLPLGFITADAERMRITSGGNVEIANGTLTTSAGSGTSYCARLQTIYSFPYVENYLDAVAGVSYQGRFHFRTNAGNGAFVTNIRIESSGAVFLPAYGNGTMAISGGQITTSSDKNLKIDDGGIENALNKVLQLNPRYFYWKEESGIETTERQLGFYAQDVNEALGVEVANDNGNGKWGIYDRALIAMLTKAIQELSAKVTALENK